MRRKGGTAVTRMEHTGTHGLESAEKLLPAACDGGWRGGGGVCGGALFSHELTGGLTTCQTRFMESHHQVLNSKKTHLTTV